MKNFIKDREKELKNEKGSASTLVLFTVLMFVVILMGTYMTITTMRKAQLKSDIRIQQIYGEEVKRINVGNELERNLVIIRKVKHTPQKYPRGQGKPLKEPIK